MAANGNFSYSHGQLFWLYGDHSQNLGSKTGLRRSKEKRRKPQEVHKYIAILWEHKGGKIHTIPNNTEPRADAEMAAVWAYLHVTF